MDTVATIRDGSHDLTIAIAGTAPGPLDWHELSIEAAAARLATDLTIGLTEAVAEVRLRESGYNELTETVPPAWWWRLTAKLNDLSIWILLAATAVAALLHDWLEASAIFAIVLLNALLSFFQEEKAERALSSLKKLTVPNTTVIRGGQRQLIKTRELVRGDLVELGAGDHVPADVRLITTFNLKVQEAALTGESVAVQKDAGKPVPENAGLADCNNMAYAGTTVVAGKGLAIVTAIGMATELGRIATFLQTEKRDPTPLQKRLTELGRVLILACLALVAITSAVQLWRGESLTQTFLLAVSLAVAAVPEGLPAVVTIALALGLQRMVRRNALIRRLASVETLGCVTVICSDKTGTLTRNEMTVTDIIVGETHYRVSGIGYIPNGLFSRLTEPAGPEATIPPSDDADLIVALTVGLWCNNAGLNPPADNEQDWQLVGDPTEGALLVAAKKAGIDRESGATVIHEIPFEPERKLMSVVVRKWDGNMVLYSKGAPEVVLQRCPHERCAGKVIPLSTERRNEILRQSAAMANDAHRVLAVAYRNLPPNNLHYNEEDLIFGGLIGMTDPPREEIRDAVRKCRSAGIKPIVITGDHPVTGLAVTRALGISGPDDQVLTGPELDGLSDDVLSTMIERVSLYARVSPEHKVRVVKALKEHNHVVAMTGDGVNDAPAVKMADIGIAMGITGTDVTKDASDMVLMDDNFASIVSAVEEGRGIYHNIQEFVHYLLSCNASEIALVLFAALVGWPVPLLPIQILWINLITDGLPALALAMEKPDPNSMNRPPRPPNEPFFTKTRSSQILIHGALMSIVTIIAFGYAYYTRGASHAQAIAFCVATFAQLFFSFACRSQRYTLPELGILTNPFLLSAIALSALLQVSLLWFPLTRHVFFRAPPNFGSDWLVILALALAPVTVVETAKIVRGWFRKSNRAVTM